LPKSYFVWKVSPEIFHVGFFTLRWYSICFMLAFIFGFFVLDRMFKKEHVPELFLNDLFYYVFISTVIGARLGHCLFYEPVYYFHHPLEILQVWRGGLASHGAAIGILIAIYLLSKKNKRYSYLWILDRVVIVVASGGFFIRVGNLFNSEIIGKTTEVPWAFIFARVDLLPRHPTQLYEALAYLAVFGLLMFVYTKYAGKPAEGLLSGLFLIGVFTSRFFIEFLKENQSAFESGMILNMGQILSIPFVLSGIWFVIRTKRLRRS